MSVEPIEADIPPIVEARPGHADFAGMLKYSTHDLRNILERSSARNTATLVAVGSICRIMLATLGVRILSHVVVLGGIHVLIPFPPNYDEIQSKAEI